MKSNAFETKFGIRYLPSLQHGEGLQNEFPYLYRIPYIGKEMKMNYEKYRVEFETHREAEVEVRFINDEKGRGLFALRDFEAGEWIAAYTGIVHEYKGENPYALHYPTKLFSIRYYVVDAREAGNIARFANHSDEPNLTMIALEKERILYPALITNRKIVKGEELVFSYSA